MSAVEIRPMLGIRDKLSTLLSLGVRVNDGLRDRDPYEDPLDNDLEWPGRVRECIRPIAGMHGGSGREGTSYPSVDGNRPIPCSCPENGESDSDTLRIAANVTAGAPLWLSALSEPAAAAASPAASPALTVALRCIFEARKRVHSRG